MARRLIDENGGGGLPPHEPFPDHDSPGRPVPEPSEGPVEPRVREVIDARFYWADAVNLWQIANAYSEEQFFADAEIAYEESQKAVIRYFQKFYTNSPLHIVFDIQPNTPSAEKLRALVLALFDKRDKLPALWSKIRRRREAITLEELQKPDWGGFSPAADQLLKRPTATETAEQSVVRQESLDYFALILANVFVPLARAEMNRIRRNVKAAVAEYEGLLRPVRKSTDGAPPIWLTCDFIERPFILLALGEIRMELAEVQFKTAGQGKADEALVTYESIPELLKDHGAYVTGVMIAQQKLTEQANQSSESSSGHQEVALQVLGGSITVPGFRSSSKALPGLSQTKAPTESWLEFDSADGGAVIAETNPRIYALLLHVQARLLQIEKGFNYIGYRDDYVPPWRFQFLLERARYFAEHSKNGQRDYLNFLNNAEHEEFQEQNAAQAVEMEKANVGIETARVGQARAEMAAAEESQQLARAVASDAERRFRVYKNIDAALRDIEADSFRLSAKRSLVNMWLGVATENSALVVNSIIDFSASEVRGKNQAARMQRAYEIENLNLAIGEASKAASVAEKQHEVAKAGYTVSCLQRQAALLRHEFAIQNLRYLRNRTLNAEQWFRLANAIRGVADIYLRYAIELAFLAEQAYEFEADKRINVIRFDYDQSEVGAYLAADFLLSDLDTIEQDFIVNQRQRQQQARYVLSMVREFPAALEELRETGKVNFLLRLEQIEKRFPGLYNVRVGMVDVLPVALMDSTRFSLDLTHTGSGQLRIKGQPDVPVGVTSESVLNINDLPAADYDWTKTPQELWPVKILVTEPETAIFSGLSRQDSASAFPVASSGQRNAFEGRGLAGGWQIDLSARENQVVPDSLADLLITFTVSGYHDSGLRAAIDGAKPLTTALTSFLSARQIFPDAFYDFSHTGRMVWQVPREMLALNGDLGRLRNIGMSLQPGAPDVNFSRLMARFRLNFRVNQDAAGTVSDVTLFTIIPACAITQPAPMTVKVSATMDGPSELAWDFGDDSPLLLGVPTGTPPVQAAGSHTYKKPGRYVIKLRCVRGETFSELRFRTVVSRSSPLGEPLFMHVNRISVTPERTVKFELGGEVRHAGRMLWRVGGLSAEGNIVTFPLKPGNYTLDFAAVRKLNFRAYGAQRYVNGAAPLPLQGLTAATNRTFDQNGSETNGTGTPPLPVRNELAKRLFDKGAISPEDDWTFELIPQEILGLPAETAIGTEELDLSEFRDAMLSMEYDVTPGGP